jgi:hypothetical protein
MLRWLVPALLVTAILAGAVLLFLGYAIGVHGGICDPYNCPSETTRATGRYLLPIGASMLGVGAVALAAWRVSFRRERLRDTPPRRKPTLREL